VSSILSFLSPLRVVRGVIVDQRRQLHIYNYNFVIRGLSTSQEHLSESILQPGFIHIMLRASQNI